MTEPLRLTDLRDASPGLRRVAHGYATSGTWKRVATRATSVGQEVLAALPKDAIRASRLSVAPLRMQDGIDLAPDATRIALYVHYSATGQVSEMVRCQLGLLRQFGVAIVFITMSENIPEADWRAVRQLCALVVQRENFGRDFGAWHDLMPEVRRRWPQPQELMLANDSVLGPIYPLAPVIEAMRSGGEGLFGLTESLQGGPHLQSYLLLARGAAVVRDLMDFLQNLRVSHSKWLLVQRGEIRLARWMRRRGHRVAAVFGYDRLAEAAVADPAERRRLMGSSTKLRDLDRLPAEEASALLHEWPLNPTQHLWHVLATKFGDPFVKTELVLRNPGRLPGVETWPAVVPADSPCPLPMLQAHLRTMTAG
ncbi:rhamnan synthesis F family protein [Rhodopila sp.]|uniref:rhamnan synthesis F family protein n=1 Tax=Rhodopila sp. TaxID=2480087 RepID=UPI003D132C80